MGHLSLTEILSLVAGYLLTAIVCFWLGRRSLIKKLPGPNNRRRYSRVKPPRTLPVQVQLMMGELLEVLKVEDISEGGLGVVTPKSLSGAGRKDDVELILILPHEPSMRLIGEIILGGRDERGQAKCGVSFRSISEADRAKIRTYVNRVLQQFPLAAR